ncbi:UDP-N-acetylmuramoylalanyl-D-glutamate--2,6-diaminopimelate ligase [Oceanobacillus limi]|uniref:UDP-N-acetylmuramoyl-L-alanyl-D-glutamate--2,6-diaminopimelate ligase n=1 Tax=Oceanobacillus limi TaxID=930131 RepID=A0A1I0DDC4_9BACI|nr:UDP-N-acetylmuramoyl-L-alanyl-D-glutamate--2,6-diaminopimelate ligase [Oceanobacillus limi]SET30305.1 UDP-N-acetylmuramoylalanyl-D-glutamate--2,6-diaminopimelate ligase [Oceanobacillus limi]
MHLKDIVSFISVSNNVSYDDNIEVTSIETDSRKVKKGSLFVAISGFTVDGHDFIDDAINNGAVAVMVEKEVQAEVATIKVSDTKRALAMTSAMFYGNPTSKVPMIGITGTNGKTTITYLLERIFNRYHKKTGIFGTIQMKIGEESFPIQNTTPDALFLQRKIAEMIQQDVDQVIMEVSSHALDMGRVFGCDYDIAVFTNLSQDHLDYHDSMEDYLRAKSLLFAQLGNGYQENNKKAAVINVDDPSSTLLMKSTAQHVITYGCHTTADVMAENIQLAANGTKFTLKTILGTTEIHSKLIGKFNVYNMLASVAVAIASDIPLVDIKESLESIEGVKGRFESVIPDHKYSVIVDYAHTPDSLENVLQTIQEIAERNIYVVVGCGGDRDKTKRPLMAQIAHKYADYPIFTSDNPRTEDPEAILKDMTDGLPSDSKQYEVIADRRQAIRYAIQRAEEKDVILIAGKGHETYQQIGHKKYDFDDREVALEVMREREN